MKDPEGQLEVGERGPFWIGSVTLKGISYSHTPDYGVLVFSKTHLLGVDAEKVDRVMKKEEEKIARRFFHPDETASLQKNPKSKMKKSFLDLWMKKESYSKLKREPLVKVIRLEVHSKARFEVLPKIPEGYVAILAIESNESQIKGTGR